MAKVEGLGFEITELRLGLPGGEGPAAKTSEKKRVFSQVSGEKNGSACGGDGPKMVQTKSQVVGWPPVCSYRRKNSFGEKPGEVAVSKMYVKVSMDGAPFLRKIDLGMHKEYSDLVVALEKLFGCFGIGKALKDADGSDYITIYEDKEGDWMLVGDVPWEMFMDSCKRLRIMKRSEAKGFNLQPRGPLKNLPSEDRG